MPSFVSTSSPTFSSYFSKKDNKYDISVLVISFITFCALSTFCGIIFTVNFTGWFVITVIGGFITKCRQELIKSLTGKKKGNMLDHRLNSRHHINHFEEFRLSSSKDLPSIPSYRTNKSNNKSNSNNNKSNKLDSILSSFDFSFSGLTGNNNNNNNNSNNKSNKNKKNIPVLPPSEYSIKRNGKLYKIFNRYIYLFIYL
jgi:hypothetical protein